MRFEVLHGSIDEIYRDLPVEHGDVPFRIRRFAGDAFGKIGFCSDKKSKQSLTGYAPVIMGKCYLFQMFACAQTDTKTPAGYFHALITEAEPKDFTGDFSRMWNLKFASQKDLLAAAEGEIFHVEEVAFKSSLELEILPKVMKEIMCGCLNRWSSNQEAVIILVPKNQPFMAYTKAVLSQIYSYFPAALRAASGFVSAPCDAYQPDRNVSLVFLPDNEKNELKPNALRIGESFGYFSKIFSPEMEAFVDYTLQLDEEQRAAWLDEIFQQVEGNGESSVFHDVKAQDYLLYYMSSRAWKNLSNREILDHFSRALEKHLAPGVYKQMRKLLSERFPQGMTFWALQEIEKENDLQEILYLVDSLNQISRSFPTLEWDKNALLEPAAQVLLQQCDHDEYKLYRAFVHNREYLSECFDSVPVQDMVQRLQHRKDELVEEQYQELLHLMRYEPDKIQLIRCYPENKTRCSRRFAEAANHEFHRLIEQFPMEHVEELFAVLKQKIDQCRGLEDEPSVQDMQACYDAYWGLWQAAQSQEAQNLPAYFQLLTQISQIPSDKLRPALLKDLRQWLCNLELLEYINGYEQFCEEHPEITQRLGAFINKMIEEDFQILSCHPLHMTISNHTGIKRLFEQCNAYLAQLQRCGLENIRAEILLQFHSPILIESYLISIQELMAIAQFILLNATSPLPPMPQEKQEELLLAFASIGVFKSVHFEALLKISESRNYQRKMWKYCMEQAEKSLNEQVRLAEIYEKCLGSIEAGRQLEQWYHRGMITQELYRRLLELHQGDGGKIRRRTTSEDFEPDTPKEENPFDFDLRCSETSNEWEDNPYEVAGLMSEIGQISREICEEQERAQRGSEWKHEPKKTGKKIKTKKENKEFLSACEEAVPITQHEKKVEKQPKKRKFKLKRMIVSLTILLAVILIGVQLFKYFIQS